MSVSAVRRANAPGHYGGTELGRNISTSFAIRIMLLLALSGLSATAPAYELQRITGSLFRFVDDRHRAAVLITDAGALVVDPLNRSAALWLKETLRRDYDTRVVYVVFSHNHSDHIYGAEVFDEPGVIFVAHELAKQDIVRTHADTVVPDVTFSESMTVSLGGSDVRLDYHGPNDGRGSISVLFQREKALFVVDWIVVGRMPWQKLWSYDIQGMINSMQEVLGYDFDTFFGGHGDVGRKADVVRALAYLEDLYSAVIDGIQQGQDLEQLKRSIRLDRYDDLQYYEDWLPLNIEGVYRRLMDESGIGWRP